MAETTKICRKQQIRRYKKFCVIYSLSPFPCTASQASLYATYLADKLSPTSIRNYVSAVWYFSKLKGHPDYSGNFVLKATLDGIERLSDVIPVVTYPLSSQDMLKIYSMLDMSIFVDKIFWVSILLAFRCVLRICHVTNSIHSLLIKDVVVCDKFIKVHIRSSKTDQYGRKPYNVYLRRVDSSVLCPGSILCDLVNHKDADPDSFLFKIRGHRQQYIYVNNRLKELGHSIVTKNLRLSTHSLRHGGATFLKNLGMSTLDIMRKANWKSNAVFNYLHDSTRDLLDLDILPSRFLKDSKI